MSGLLNTAEGVQHIRADDRRAVEYGFDDLIAYPDGGVFASGDSFANEWWPADDSDGGDTSRVRGHCRWAEPYPVSGANGRLAIVGYTRDALGSPIGNATVKIFRTSDDSLQSTVTSDANGLYSITSPYADGHYLIVYKAGPPDICGTTINTLAPG